MTVKVSLNENDRVSNVLMCYNANILDCLWRKIVDTIAKYYR